jgi:hypothetical protein
VSARWCGWTWSIARTDNSSGRRRSWRATRPGAVARATTLTPSRIFAEIVLPMRRPATGLRCGSAWCRSSWGPTRRWGVLPAGSDTSTISCQFCRDLYARQTLIGRSVQCEEASRVNGCAADEGAVDFAVYAVDEDEALVGPSFVDADDDGKRAIRAEVGLDAIGGQVEAVHAGPIADLAFKHIDLARQAKQLLLAFFVEVALRCPAGREGAELADPGGGGGCDGCVLLGAGDGGDDAGCETADAKSAAPDAWAATQEKMQVIARPSRFHFWSNLFRHLYGKRDNLLRCKGVFTAPEIFLSHFYRLATLLRVEVQLCLSGDRFVRLSQVRSR